MTARLPLMATLLFTTVTAHALPPAKHAARVIGHRGAMGYAPENTLASFKKAHELGAQMFELDVYRLRDGRIMVIHDHTLDRTTDKKGMVATATAKSLAGVDAGSGFGEDFAGEPVPLLDDVLAWARGRIEVNVEIKGPGCEEDVVKLIEKHAMVDTTIVTSFHHEFLVKIKELNPKVLTGALIHELPNGMEQLERIIEEVRPDAINPSRSITDEALVNLAHKHGLPVNVYTVNKPEDMNHLLDLGVDGIITNYPDRLLAVLEERR